MQAHGLSRCVLWQVLGILDDLAGLLVGDDPGRGRLIRSSCEPGGRNLGRRQPRRVRTAPQASPWPLLFSGSGRPRNRGRWAAAAAPRPAATALPDRPPCPCRHGSRRRRRRWACPPRRRSSPSRASRRWRRPRTRRTFLNLSTSPLAWFSTTFSLSPIFSTRPSGLYSQRQSTSVSSTQVFKRHRARVRGASSPPRHIALGKLLNHCGFPPAPNPAISATHSSRSSPSCFTLVIRLMNCGRPSYWFHWS